MASRDLDRQLTAGRDYGNLASTGAGMERGALGTLTAATNAARGGGTTTTTGRTTLPKPSLLGQTAGAIGTYNALNQLI